MEQTRRQIAAMLAPAYILVTLANFYIFDRLTGLLGMRYLPASVIYAFALSTLLLVGVLVRTSSGRGTGGPVVEVASVCAPGFGAGNEIALLEMRPNGHGDVLFYI